MAPGAHLVVLKALDVSGNGFTSNVIAAIDYAIANRATYNIRVLNLSVAAGVYESFTTDPLTLAAKRAVDSGIVVVAAAGNRGRDGSGQPQYGGIASPGNAPWVLTVGASSDLGTVDRRDDVVAAFSSRGPAPIDDNAKPDLVAPGVNIESTADPSSALYAANPASRLWGSAKTGSEPYLSLTGTSMAAPVVTGAIALMLEANAALTPNAVKAILEYTAEARAGYNHLTQGAGFLNARGAVELARAFAGTTLLPELSSDPVRWSRQIIWGNRRVAGGMLGARANAWQLGVTWGDARTTAGDVDCLGRAVSRRGHRLQPGAVDRTLRRGHTGLRSVSALGHACPNSTSGANVGTPRDAASLTAWGTDPSGASAAAPERRARQPAAACRHRGSRRMKTLPTPARLYVGGVIALGAALLVAYFPVQTFSNPGRLVLFGLLLFLSAITSIFKVNLPLTRSGSTMSVSYAVDFASLLLLGPHETMIVAAASAYSQCTFRIKERNPLHRTLFSMACLVITVQAAGAAYHLLGGVRRAGRPGDAPQAARRCGDDLLRRQHAGDRHGDRALHQPGGLQGLEREFPLERAELLRRRGRLGGRDVDGHRMVGALDHAARRGAALPDLPHLQGLSGPHRRRAASRARDGGPASGDDRSARARDRRQGSDVAVAHPAGAALRGLGRAGRWACRTTTSRASRPRRCCTTSASSPCPSTSCRSPGR